jgi:hypothetical protein
MPTDLTFAMNRRTLFIAFFVAAMAFILYGASVKSSADLLNPDERVMTYIVLDRFTGSAPMALEWPAGPLQAAGVPLIAADYALHHAIAPDSLVQYLGQAYREPWHIVFLLRCVVAVCCAFGLALFAVMVYRATNDLALAIVAATMCATIPIFWQHSRAATGDAMSVGFAFAAVALLYRTRSTFALVASGTLFGLAVASKYPIALTAPMLLVVAVDGEQRDQIPASKALPLLVLGIALGVMMAIPHLWVDPMRLLKGVGGAISRPGVVTGPFGAMRLVITLFPIWAWVALPLGMLAAVFLRRPWFAAALFFSCLLQLLVIGRAGVVYPRYLLGFTVLTGLAVCVSLEWLIRRPRPVYWGGLAVLSACALSNVITDVRLPSRLAKPTIAEAIDEVTAADPSLKVVAVSWFDVYDAYKYASQASLERLAASCGDALAAEIRGERRLQINVPSALERYLPGAFSDDEQTCAARALLMSAVPPAAPELDVVVWGRDDLPRRFGLQDLASVLADREAGKIGLIFSRRPLPGQLPLRVWSNGLTAY